MTFGVRGGKGVVRRRGPRQLVPRLVGPVTPEARAVRYLWDWFGDQERRRLKRCPVCETWFVDVTRPGNSQRCSRKCTWTVSNRLRAAPKGPRRA